MSRIQVPAEGCDAMIVRAGELLRIVAIAGAQTCDVNLFVLPELHERFSAGRTRTRSGIHPTVGDGLWSNPPYDRLLMTIVADSVQENDVLFPRCSRIRYEEVGLIGHSNCQDNLAQAVAPYGLSADDVHDTFNVFMNTRVRPDGSLAILEGTAEPGDRLEALARLDLLVAVSACPDGDKYGRTNRPILIEVVDETRVAQ